MHLDTGLHRRRHARVEVIPLIDCMFILLVFFIYSMLNMTIQRGVPVSLPLGRQLELLTEEAIVISVTESGAFLINREEIAAEALAAGLAQAAAPNPSPRFVINADARAAHGQVFRVLEALRHGGWTNVSILSSEAKD